MTRAHDVDTNWVAGKRAANVSWSAIARMAGCNEVDLRRIHQAGFVADTPRRTPAPRDQVEAALREAGLHPDYARIVGRLWHANGARVKAEDLCRGLAGGAAACNLVRDARTAAQRCGVAFEIRSGVGFALSAEGIARVSKLAGLRGRP